MQIIKQPYLIPIKVCSEDEAQACQVTNYFTIGGVFCRL